MSEDIDEKKAKFVTKCIEQGYSVKSADALYYNYNRRKEVMSGAEGRELTSEEKQEIARTRKSDKEIIEYDWKENQPEKYAVHYVKEISKMNNKIDGTESESEKVILEKEKHDFMAANKDWVIKNKEVVMEVMQQLNEVSKPKKMFLSTDNKYIKFFRNRER